MDSPRYPTPRVQSQSPTKSPAQGLEKLIAELKLERQKCTNALQDRSKLKIELEKVKQSLIESQEELQATEAHNQRLLETFTLNENRIYELEGENLVIKDELNQLKKRYLRLEEENQQLSHEVTEMRGIASNGRGGNGDGQNALTRIDELESIVTSKNSIIQQLENELKQARKMNENNEKKLLELSHALDLKTHEGEDLRSLHVRIEEMTSSHSRLQQTCEELREELEDSIKKNSDLAGKLKEVTETSRVLQNNEQKYKMEISQLVGMMNKYKQEIADYELIHMELNQRIEAEMETTQISQSLAQDAMKSKEFYEKQIDILKASYDESLKRFEELEESFNELKSQNLTLQSELSSTREDLSAKELLLKEGEEYKVVASEVHQLRSQLLEIRKKIIYNNYTEEMNNVSGAGGGEGSHSNGGGSFGNRRVYESIIEDLRSQLEKMTASYEESQRKLSEMRTRVMKLEELEEELHLYKETAKKVALENQSVLSSINEAHERNERTTHEMNNRLRDLKAAEAEVHNLTIEKERIIEEMEAMKSRVREMMLEKLSAERKMSEAIARNTRNESTIDNWKLRAEKAELELGRKERIINEQQIVISDLKAKRAESDRQRLILLEKSSANTTIPSPFHQSGEKREDELELIQLRQIKEILEKELNALKKSLKSQKDHNAEQLVEIKKLHEEIALLNKQKELFQMDLLQQQSTRTEYQLSELRKDISETTLNWEITEQNNQRFQEIAAKYQELIQREQEKVVLLETQNQLLEERMEMMKQELNIFRSLDIYEATITSEMKKYHSRRSPLVSKKPITQAEKKENYQSEEPLLSSDDEYDGAYHSAKASHPSPAPVPLTTHSSRSSTTATRLSGSRVDSHTTPLNWGSEPKGDGDDRNLPGDEDVGPELVLRDISQSPQLPLRAQTSLKSSFDSVKSNLQSHNLQDSKQITPSLTRNLERRDVFSPSQVKERSDSTWKPSPSPALLSRHLGSQNEVKSRTVGSAKPEVPSRIPNQQERNTSTDTPTSATRTHQTLRAGGLTQSSRPSKEEFERAKKLLAKR